MAVIAFDTLKFSKRLKESGVLPAQAEAEAEALAEVLEVNLKDLATKEDVLLMRKDMGLMEQNLNSLEQRLFKEMDSMEQRLTARFDAKISDSKAELIRWVVMVGVLQIALITALVLKLAPN